VIAIKVDAVLLTQDNRTPKNQDKHPEKIQDPLIARQVEKTNHPVANQETSSVSWRHRFQLLP